MASTSPPSRPPHRGSVAFCWEMLPRTSRTFALTIPLLPRPLDDITAMAYLLCRVADTIEDESAVSAQARADLLHELSTLVALPVGWRETSADFADRAGRQLAHGTDAHHVRLVTGLPVLLDDLAGRPSRVRELVGTCVREMCAGMALTVRRDRAAGLDNVDQVLSYCDIVAGTVGRMLTGLFAWHSRSVAVMLPALEPHATAFGRVLQLTNILKDVRGDLDAGRCWLPRDVLADHGIHTSKQLRDPALATGARDVLRKMIAVTQRELDEAVSYVGCLPVADVAIRRFCVTPLVMAILTLRKLWHGREVFGAQPLKISHGAVRSTLLVARANAAWPATTGLMFATLRQPLPAPSPPATEKTDRPTDDAVQDR